MDTSVPTVRIGGLDIARLDRAETADLIVSLAMRRDRQQAPPPFLTSANGQVLSLAANQPEFRSIVETADVVSADGQPMVLASQLIGPEPLPERVATTDLFHDVASRAEQMDLSFYLLGATEQENDAAVENVRRQYPRLKIAGARHGYIAPNDEVAVVERIAEQKPDVLWISMGVPREQQFVKAHLQRLSAVGVVKTSGGLFNFLSGSASRAPNWMQSVGLEWLYRALREPRRLGGRYVRTNLHATYLLLSRTG